MILQYDGTNYNGWQIQTGQAKSRTIQGTIQEALYKLTGEKIKVTAAGRTDAGVHARGQVINFKTESTIPVSRFPKALNSCLPPDIVAVAAEQVDEQFHARYSAKRKLYRYTIDVSPYPDVFRRRYAYHVPYSLKLSRMEEAASYIEGNHDFRSFCAAGSSAKNFVRTVEMCRVSKRDNIIEIDVMANGFLYHMARIIVGTLLEVGKGKIKPEDVKRIIAAKNRDAAGPTAPSHGLCLEKVEY